MEESKDETTTEEYLTTAELSKGINNSKYKVFIILKKAGDNKGTVRG